MTRAYFALPFILILAACAGGGGGTQLGPDGLPLPTRYVIQARDRDAILLRQLDGVNSLRRAAGLFPVRMDAALIAAAATHSRDMSLQNRPWHFGSDGSSPLDRAQRTGFTGEIAGEVIAETYETELETLAAWMEQADTRAIILDPKATSMGFAWHQERSGKIWWTMVFGK